MTTVVAPVRLLTFTTLFPHAGLPNQGIFVENRLRHLLQTREAETVVLAPVPWFPSRSERFGTWGRMARADCLEVRHGLTVHHPRYPLIPKVGMLAAPLCLYAASAASLSRLQQQGLRFDLIDAHYLYPDGVAAVLLGRRFNKPVVITARGSDITQLPDHAGPRRMIQWAMKKADALISVSAGLKQAMVQLGAAPGAVTVLRNGVDLDAFRPDADREACRRALCLTRRTLLSVGHLIERKGHHHVIAALVHLPDWQLMIVGEGPERGRLQALINQHGLADRVHLAGAQPHSSLPRYYTAADMLVLASSREGWANVLLEAMACGTPVVASNIPGNPEVVQEPAAGLIVERNSPEGFAAGVMALQAALPLRTDTRAYAERFSWEATSAGQLSLFRRVLSRSSSTLDLTGQEARPATIPS